MRWITYKLYQELSKSNSIGQPRKVFVPIGDIECVVSHKLYSNVTGDVVYRVVAPTGITRYKDLSIEKTYVLEGEGHQYKVTSINNKGRYTQLLLEETHFTLHESNVDVTLNGTTSLSGDVKVIKNDGKKAVLSTYLDGKISLSEEDDVLA